MEPGEPGTTTADLIGMVRELGTTIADRFDGMERRLRRVEGGTPHGYMPDDSDGDGGGGLATPRPRRPAGDLVLGPRDSFAAWVAERGHGQAPPAGEFSLGRLVQGMISGERGTLTEIERWAQTEGTDATGGVLVPDPVAGFVFDLVRARSVLAQLVTVVPMESDTLTWPQIVTGATPEWKAELEAMPESNLVFGKKELNAKTLRTKVVLSAELSEDMTPAGAAAIEAELIAAFALEIDRVCLYGTGTNNQPTGVKATSGITTFPPAAGFAYSDVSAAIFAVRQNNHEPTAAVLSAQAAGALDALTEGGGSTGQPLNPSPAVAAMPQYVTNLVDVGAGAGDIFVAEWPQLILGARPTLGVRIRQLDARLAEDFAVEIVAWQRADVILQDPKAFAVVSD
jgi:HK97 family phage major capsid protein